MVHLYTICAPQINLQKKINLFFCSPSIFDVFFFFFSRLHYPHWQSLPGIHRKKHRVQRKNRNASWWPTFAEALTSRRVPSRYKQVLVSHKFSRSCRKKIWPSRTSAPSLTPGVNRRTCLIFFRCHRWFWIVFFFFPTFPKDVFFYPTVFLMMFFAWNLEMTWYNMASQNTKSSTSKEQQIAGWTQVSAHGTGARIPPVDVAWSPFFLIIFVPSVFSNGVFSYLWLRYPWHLFFPCLGHKFCSHYVARRWFSRWRLSAHPKARKTVDGDHNDVDHNSFNNPSYHIDSYSTHIWWLICYKFYRYIIYQLSSIIL